MRSDKEVIDQTNELARKFYEHMGYEVPSGYRFDRARHPQERLCWVMACTAQDTLTDTDPNDILNEEDL